jgi:PhzF family phenazine biosynthesis protein
MSSHRYRLVNVFAEASSLSGNPLAVFEDGRLLEDSLMQAIALQLNLSETTFVLPSEVATARVRIFAPAYELPFAGHPTLGTAHVVRTLRSAGDSVTLEMRAGIIPVTARGDTWTLQAKEPKTRSPSATRAEIAGMLAIDEASIRSDPTWVDTGSEQLVVPLTSADAVDRCAPDARLLARYGANGLRQGLVYVFAFEGDDRVVARCFFLKHGALAEDPGTGSACANLGGWLVATGAKRPVDIAIRQGEHTGRRCRLALRVDASGRIYVGGRVVDIGTGSMVLSP